MFTKTPPNLDASENAMRYSAVNACGHQNHQMNDLSKTGECCSYIWQDR